MIVRSLLLLFHLHFWRPIRSTSQSGNDQSCWLPYVTEPCQSVNRSLTCSFSWNSSERRNTCNLSSLSLIFSTADYELFLVRKYLHQILTTERQDIRKLILLPTGVNRTCTYSFWLSIFVWSIEIPIISSNTVRIIHELDNLTSVQHRDQRNRSSWNVQISRDHRHTCQMTTFSSHQVESQPFICPFDAAAMNRCGTDYACLQGEPCFYTGDRQLTCRIVVLMSDMVFLRQSDAVQYESILLDVKNEDVSALHVVQLETFFNESRTNFVTKRLIIAISKGILQTTSAFFEYRSNFQVRIEHGTCDEGTFLLDIIDDSNRSVSASLVDYISGETGGLNCRLNGNE